MFVARPLVHEGSDRHECVEPPAGLIDRLGNEVGGVVIAEPLDTATSLIAIISASPSTNANDTFRLPGSRRSASPFKRTSSSLLVRRRCKRYRRARTRPFSSTSVIISSQALAKPTMPATEHAKEWLHRDGQQRRDDEREKGQSR